MLAQIAHLPIELRGCCADQLLIEGITVEPIRGHDAVIGQNRQSGMASVVQAPQSPHHTDPLSDLYQPLSAAAVGRLYCAPEVLRVKVRMAIRMFHGAPRGELCRKAWNGIQFLGRL